MEECSQTINFSVVYTVVYTVYLTTGRNAVAFNFLI